jgi:hypothetical protein
MTSYSPRIYTYKITFEEVPYYYYGVHKERAFGEPYWGSPYTHKWYWETYTPKKQILEFFDYNDDGWIEAQEVEKRLIQPVYNIDEYCLNENCGGLISLNILRENGRKAGRMIGLQHKENKTGVCGQSIEKMRENGRKAGKIAKENKTGIFALTPEQMKENSRKSGIQNYENRVGIFSRTPEEMTEHGRKSGLLHKEKGTGIFALTSDEKRELGKKTCSQRWKCLETGFITNPGNLSKYQKARGIDTSKRIRLS